MKTIPRLDFRDPTLAPSRLNQLDACPGYIGAVLEQDTDAMDEGTALLVKAQDLAEEMRKHNLTHLGQLQLR